MISEIHLKIGSNSGDRRAFIARAVAALHMTFGITPRVSAESVSEPWGYESAMEFINVGVALDIERHSPWSPEELEELLSTVKRLERGISSMPHRNAAGEYTDRELDIDIIAVDDIMYSSPALTLPHPHMSARRFVLEPLAELAPEWKHPQTGLTPAQMIAGLRQ